MNYDAVLKAIRALPVEEQRALMEVIEMDLSRNTNRKTHSILEFEGVGAELWKDIDVEAYINEMRCVLDQRQRADADQRYSRFDPR
jgi:hypothetical protein